MPIPDFIIVDQSGWLEKSKGEAPAWEEIVPASSSWVDNLDYNIRINASAQATDWEGANTFTPSSGSNTYSIISRITPDDSIFIHGDFGSESYFTYSPISLPINAANIQVTSRVRCRCSVDQVTVAGTLYDPRLEIYMCMSEGGGGIGSSTYITPTSEWADYSYTWSTNPFSTLPWRREDFLQDDYYIDNPNWYPLTAFGLAQLWGLTAIYYVSQYYLEISYDLEWEEVE